MYRYFIGADTDHEGFHSFFKHESPTLVDVDELLRTLDAALRPALEQAGFVCVDPVPNWSVNVEHVHVFRGEEVIFPDSLENVAEAITKVGPEDVLVEAYRRSHNSGERYDSRLLTVPKGSRLPSDSSGYHKDAFDKNVNWISGMDSNSEETVNLPENAKAWDGTQWVPISKLEYHY